MGVIINLRFALIRRTRREIAFRDVWRPVLVEALVANELSPSPSPLPALPTCDRVFFLGLWIQLQESVRGPESTGLRNVAHRVGCEGFAKNMLISGNPSERLLAILALGHLREHSAWNLLTTLAQDKNSTISFNALRTLTRIDPETTAASFTPLITARHDWPLSSIATLLQGAQAAFARPLLDAAAHGTGEQLVRTLHLLEALRLQLPLPFLSGLLEANQPAETIIAALRVTYLPELLIQVRELLTNPDWRIRVQVCKVLGRLGEQQDLLHLKNLLGDPEWWVRYSAAKALCGLPFILRSELETFCDTLEDAYARNMLQQVLFEEAAT